MWRRARSSPALRSGCDADRRRDDFPGAVPGPARRRRPRSRARGRRDRSRGLGPAGVRHRPAPQRRRRALRRGRRHGHEGRAVRAAHPVTQPVVLLPSPQGAVFTQARARAYASAGRLVLLCGRYEGVDDRVAPLVGAEEVSIGDYVLTGGELAAMVIIEAVVRLRPGVVGDDASVAGDSFAAGLLDFPQYTRPVEFHGLAVPDVLLSGHHEAIRRWRKREALRRTLDRRPDLLDDAALDDEARALLAELRRAAAEHRRA